MSIGLQRLHCLAMLAGMIAVSTNQGTGTHLSSGVWLIIVGAIWQRAEEVTVSSTVSTDMRV
jgi:hypothetical protein